jgi:hypothetical protein
MVWPKRLDAEYRTSRDVRQLHQWLCLRLWTSPPPPAWRIASIQHLESRASPTSHADLHPTNRVIYDGGIEVWILDCSKISIEKIPSDTVSLSRLGIPSSTLLTRRNLPGRAEGTSTRDLCRHWGNDLGQLGLPAEEHKTPQPFTTIDQRHPDYLWVFFRSKSRVCNLVTEFSLPGAEGTPATPMLDSISSSLVGSLSAAEPVRMRMTRRLLSTALCRVRPCR